MRRVAGAMAVTCTALLAFAEQPSGSIIEIADTVTQAVAPVEETAAPGEATGVSEVRGPASGAVVQTGGALPGSGSQEAVEEGGSSAEPAPLDEGTEETEAIGEDPGQAQREEAARLRAEARELRGQAERTAMRRVDFEEQVKRNEVHLRKTADEMAAHVSQSVATDSAAAVEDSVIASKRERIAKHRSLIADLQVVVDSLRREEAQLTAGAEALERQATALDGRGERAERKAEFDASKVELFKAEAEQDTRPYGIRYRLSFGYQNHYFFVEDNGGDHYAVRTAGFMLSYAIRPYLILGVRDIMLFFNESVHGDRVALTLSPFVGAALYPMRRLELEAAVGAMAQLQTGLGTGESDGAVAPYVSTMVALWPVKHFSVGLVGRVAYMATGALQAGALPSERSDVVPYGTFWFDCGLSLSFHF